MLNFKIYSSLSSLGSPLWKFLPCTNVISDTSPSGCTESLNSNTMIEKEWAIKKEVNMASKSKPGLWANINRRKRLGISRPKSKSTISAKAYANMKAGFPKKKK